MGTKKQDDAVAELVRENKYTVIGSGVSAAASSPYQYRSCCGVSAWKLHRIQICRVIKPDPIQGQGALPSKSHIAIMTCWHYNCPVGRNAKMQRHSAVLPTFQSPGRAQAKLEQGAAVVCWRIFSRSRIDRGRRARTLQLP